MDKKRKKILLVFGVLIIVAVSLMTYLVFKEPKKIDTTLIDKEPVSEEVTDEPTTDEETQVEKEETAFVTDKEKTAYYMNGQREGKEEKKEDYSYLLEQDPVEFRAKMPADWETRQTQVDKIDGFYDKTAEERAVYFEEKTDFTKEQQVEIEKIKKVNTDMYAAYQKGDYNGYLTHMYKGWREYYGIFIGKVIKTGEYKERILGFYPEVVDMNIGYACGFMVREISFYYQGEVSQKKVIDAFVMYKQNTAGDWEVYYEYQL